MIKILFPHTYATTARSPENHAKLNALAAQIHRDNLDDGKRMAQDKYGNKYSPRAQH